MGKSAFRVNGFNAVLRKTYDPVGPLEPTL
jgi:hypothetical protein